MDKMNQNLSFKGFEKVMRRGEKNKYKKKDKILILSSTFGEGHQQVAYAVREAVQSRMPDAEPVVVDFMAVTDSYFYPLAAMFT